MQTIHLTNIHLGGATPGAESGGTTPTPPPTPLPDAGKPYVEGVTYDPDTKRVRLQARVARAGEVKTPLGEVQEFPIHVPTPPPAPALPDAGKAYADSCTYDHATRTVTVHARNPQAGEVKSPDGETRQFHIEVPEVPQVTGVVYEYDVTNMSHSLQLVSADDEAHPGEQMGATEATLPPVDPAYGTVFLYSYVKPFPEGIQLSLRPLTVSPGKASYLTENLVVLGSNLVITRQVSITD